MFAVHVIPAIAGAALVWLTGLLAREMGAEGLPEELVQTVRTGWWTTCLEILPAKERRRGKY